VTVDKQSIVGYMYALLNVQYEPVDIHHIIQNICSRLALSNDILEVVCLVYLRSIKFNISYISIKHMRSISSWRERNEHVIVHAHVHEYIPFIQNVYKYVTSMDTCSVQDIRIFCVYAVYHAYGHVDGIFDKSYIV
jgi:hypothetical protein